MSTTTMLPDQARSAAGDRPRFVFHTSFEELDAQAMYGNVPANTDEQSTGFMPDEITRDFSKRMHYAAWRASKAPTRREATRMLRRYVELRNRVVLGNCKLVHRAVQKWRLASRLTEDMTSECQIVLIKAAAAFNPWLGIRFSTYTFTCLLRALSRLSQRQAADRLSHSLPLEWMPRGEPCYALSDEPDRPGIARLRECFEEENTLLSPREKFILARRYHLTDDVPRAETLEQLGRELGLSKERVRQVQNSALEKLSAELPFGSRT